MKNIYYSIWSDAIINIAKNPRHEKDWKFVSFFYMSFLNALNFATILGLLTLLFKTKVIWINVTVLPGSMLNSFASFLIQFLLPFVLLNYFLILYKDRYKKIIKSRKKNKVRYFVIYLAGTLISFIVLVAYYIISYQPKA